MPDTPGEKIWERYRGCEYIVFFDESFYKFFGFQNVDGNFCHGAVGIPAKEYEHVKTLLAPLARELVEQTPRRIGQQREIKHNLLNKLPLHFRRKFALGLRDALLERGGFVAGFFTTTRGYVMEHVRMGLLETADSVPDECQQLYDETVVRLRANMRGPGVSDILYPLFVLPASAILYFLGSFDCPFRIVYDPRQEEEDRIIREGITDILDRVCQNLERQFRGLYLGMVTNIRSEEEFGLQLADVLAGEVRTFFRQHQVLRTFGYTRQLLTGVSNEPGSVFENWGGRLLKKGRILKLPGGVQQKLLRPRNNALLPIFRNLFAAGLFTCNTDFGLPRDIRIFEGTVFDHCD